MPFKLDKNKIITKDVSNYKIISMTINKDDLTLIVFYAELDFEGNELGREFVEITSARFVDAYTEFNVLAATGMQGTEALKKSIYKAMAIALATPGITS